jgi:DNA-directed RNA polymerase specialized sigma24 family protein
MKIWLSLRQYWQRTARLLQSSERDLPTTVYGYVRWRLAPRRDRVEDLVQETFLAAFDNLDQ